MRGLLEGTDDNGSPRTALARAGGDERSRIRCIVGRPRGILRNPPKRRERASADLAAPRARLQLGPRRAPRRREVEGPRCRPGLSAVPARARHELGEVDAGEGLDAETCPHDLLLDENAYADVGSLVRVNPPVREKQHQDLLWGAVFDGTIDMIATEHAPHAAAEKFRDNIWCADCGFTGVETQMPLMLTQVAARRMSPVRGLPVHTLVRGRFVMKNRELIEASSGHGRPAGRVQQMPAPTPKNLEHTTAAILCGGPAS